VTRHTFSLRGAPLVFAVDSDDVLWFWRTLRERGGNLRAHITKALEAAREMGIVVHAAKLLSDKLPQGVHVQINVPSTFDIQLAAAVISLIRAFRRALSRDPKLFGAAWRVISSGAPLAIPQHRSSDRDHVWEVINAAVHFQFASNVQLNESAAGVDVKGIFRGVRWGIECKVLYTAKVEHRIDRIIDGVKQLESDSSVEKGVVAVNVTDCIDHAPFQHSLTGDRSVFPSPAEATKALAAAVKKLALETSTPSLQHRLVADKQGNRRNKCRAVIYVGQTVALAGGLLSVFTSQVSVLRRPSEISDKAFANQYHLGLMRL
jgi:hypothetical protein